MKNINGIAGLRKQDIILASFPKSGNTWVRFFFCNIISIEKWGGQEVGFPILDRTMPELGVSNLMCRWPYDDLFPRVVKTHRKYLPVFRKNPAALIVRDPRDVMVSYYRTLTKRKEPLFRGSFSDFIRNNRFGLPAWFRYHSSWLAKKNPLVLKYEDLKADDVACFEKLIRQLGIDVRRATFEQAVERARIGQVRKSEEKYGPSDPAAKADRYFSFTEGGGSSGKWRDWFSKKDLEYYKALADKYAIIGITYQDYESEKRI